MQKSILIPIDFNVESLNTVKLALIANAGHEVNVTLLYGEHLSNSVSDLLFYSPNKILGRCMTPQFSDALHILRNSFGASLKSCHLELFHGRYQAAFDNLVHARNISEIYVPSQYTLQLKGEAFDLMPFMRRSTIPIHEMHWESGYTSNVDQLEKLFT